MNDGYQYTGRTLTPKIARELIQELFSGQSIPKQEMIEVVPRHHSERGGLPSAARSNNPVTLALWNMKREGLAEEIGKGNFRIHSSTHENENADFESIDSKSNDLEPEKIIGLGKQSVYLYYYPAYQRLAELQAEEVWACKIGKSRSDPIGRIVSQTRTALPEFPKIGLLIKTDALNLMETTIQNILRLQGKQKQDAPGTEWFITSPREVEQIYVNNFGNLQ